MKPNPSDLLTTEELHYWTGYVLSATNVWSRLYRSIKAAFICSRLVKGRKPRTSQPRSQVWDRPN